MTYAAIFLDVRDIREGCLDQTQEKEEYKTRKIPFHRIIIVFWRLFYTKNYA
jgi:hypothetical protein